MSGNPLRETELFTISRSFGWVKAVDAGGYAYIHCEINKWSPSVVRECREIWGEVADALREIGYKGMFCHASHDLIDRKMVKFWQMFGMRLLASDADGAVFGKEI